MANGEPDDVGVAEVGQIVSQVGPAGRRAGAALSGQARLPDAQHPEPLEPTRGGAVEQLVRHVVERGRPGACGRRLADEHPRVDLIQQREAHYLLAACAGGLASQAPSASINISGGSRSNELTSQFIASAWRWARSRALNP